MEHGWITITEAAQVLRCTRANIEHHIAKADIPTKQEYVDETITRRRLTKHVNMKALKHAMGRD